MPGATRGARDARGDETLEQELPDLLRAACPESRSDGELAPARCGLCEDDARDVRARDAEHDDRDEREQIHDSVDVGAEQLEQRPHDDACACVGDREVGLQLVGDRRKVCLRLLERDARFQQRCHKKPAIVAAAAFAIEDDRPYGIERPEDAPVEVGRQHAHDRVRAAIDRDDSANTSCAAES